MKERREKEETVEPMVYFSGSPLEITESREFLLSFPWCLRREPLFRHKGGVLTLGFSTFTCLWRVQLRREKT